ncbi:MAG: hypothetical protein IT437_00260 [Phycisphaerales bacterium]|nr:hypothetical protein [Phycisphaerales bacterium]
MYALLAGYAAWMVFHPAGAPSGCGCGLSSASVESWIPIAARNGVVSAGLLLIGMWLKRARMIADAIPESEAAPTPGC